MKQPNGPWQAWIFDLDDTLLDTSGELVPKAAYAACEYLVINNAASSMEQSLSLWSQWRSRKTGVDLFSELITATMDARTRQQMAEKAYRIFRQPVIPAKLNLRPGGIPLLEEAQRSIPLFLVTQGDIYTQMKKVEALEVGSYFRHVFYVDPFAGESKLQAFEAILQQHSFDPEKVLSIGNRLDNEILFGKKLGMKTCYVRFGEYQHQNPGRSIASINPAVTATIEMIADFEITHLPELTPLLSDINKTSGENNHE